MANPIWTTGYDLGTYITNVPVDIILIARPVYPATTITYAITKGSLPYGLSLANTGFITGTVDTAVPLNNIFTVRATDNLGNSSDKIFQISISSKPAQPVWNTPAGSLGTFPTQIFASVLLSGSPVLPATSITYSLISGSLPSGMVLSSAGVISGTPALVSQESVSAFTLRITDDTGNVRDRTFSMTISGSASPVLTIPDGNILQTLDSVWTELPLTYNNPNPNNQVSISISEGVLPPGLEINSAGLIRGYPNPPTTSVTLPTITTTATVTEVNNYITCFSTTGFTVGRPVVFTGTSVFGGIEAGATYYIKSISPGGGQITISTTQNGPVFLLQSGTGSMVVTLPPVSVGQPTIRTYSFTVKLSSLLGSDTAAYSITVQNQNYNNQNILNTRIPTVLNTRPRTYIIPQTDLYYGYYLLPVDQGGATYPVNFSAPIGNIQSGNQFAFKIIGYDFDGDPIGYTFNNLPTWATGHTDTGWITGNPTVSVQNITQFTFSVAVYKINNPALRSPNFSISVNLCKDLTDNIVWITDEDLGTIFNGTVSTKSVVAEADVDLQYQLISGSLPPNLTLLSNGEITGYVADEPTSVLLEQGTTTSFTFTIRAYSPTYHLIKSTKTFTIGVYQAYTQPTDVLYIKATPSIADRELINSLLNNETIIPSDMLYRPNDVYFGKATDVVYEHAYGIYASDVQQYLAAITRNHYWRNIVLGQIETAIARDENGNVIYEVVYSKVIDNLINPAGISVSSTIQWPRAIDLFLGPWYTSVTNIYTSYDKDLSPGYYTSRSPGYANTLYPNSLFNMRNRVGDVLGQEYDSRILPLWMTSQQENGNTLGYTQAWVICYTKPGHAKTIKNNIETKWLNVLGYPNKLNVINFTIDRFSVNKSITYDYDNATDPAAWTGLPSATPTPDPVDSKDFYVLFPRKTILPDETQY